MLGLGGGWGSKVESVNTTAYTPTNTPTHPTPHPSTITTPLTPYTHSQTPPIPTHQPTNSPIHQLSCACYIYGWQVRVRLPEWAVAHFLCFRGRFYAICSTAGACPRGRGTRRAEPRARGLRRPVATGIGRHGTSSRHRSAGSRKTEQP